MSTKIGEVSILTYAMAIDIGDKTTIQGGITDLCSSAWDAIPNNALPCLNMVATTKP